MARTFAGGASTDRIATTLTTGADLRSYALWAWRSGDGGNSAGRMLHKGTTGTTMNLNNNAGGTCDYSQTFSGGTGTWTFPRPALNEWHHIVVVHDSSSAANDPVFYLDGSLQTTTETSAPSGSRTSGSEIYSIGNRGNDSARAWDGRIAEVAFWDRLLSAAEAAALAKGQSPLFFPAALVEYVPIVRDVISRKAAPPTVTGTTVSDHPRIMYPGSIQAWSVVSAAPPATTWPGYVSSPGGYF